MSERLRAHYRNLLAKHGDSAESAQYSSRASQEKRFEVLAQVADLSGARVLDFGCGTGHLATYLSARGIKVRYTGVDVVEEFFEVARRKNPRARFGRLRDFAGEKFDYALVSGVFNNRRPGNRRFYQDSLKALFRRCTRGVAFNLLSTYVDYQQDDLFHESPERALRFVKTELTPFVTLRHDYEVKPGVIPFEFTIYAYRSPPAGVRARR